ncbi:hypothetical protein BJV78DRAFT_831662 [Lactifluus subvellereus]|nr:hypothetical protein BJV78DRAFT_831662 [Lactifluus subvellereus]
MRRRKSSARSHRRTKFARSDYVDEGEEGPSDEASGGEYAGEEEGENAGMGMLTARGKTTPWGRRHIFQQPDEDDELMMYASLKKIHLPQFPRRKSDTYVAAQRLSATNVLAQKRRTTETGLVRHARSGEDDSDFSSASPPSSLSLYSLPTRAFYID